jgi:hypothetical protein
MARLLRTLLTTLTGLAAACAPAPQELTVEQVSMNPEALRQALQSLTHATFFFGHQSVGGNLLDGIRGLASESGVALPIRELDGSAAPGGGILHTRLGTNGDPAGKIDAFGKLLRRPEARGVQLAAMKLCYADFDAGTDVRALAAHYTSTVEAVQRDHPELTVLHVTTPLTVRPEGARSRLQRLLGMPPGSDRANLERHRFNEQLRARHGGSALFDLARVEATDPAGRLRMYGAEAARFPALVSAYSDDGGHLNAVGRRRVAAAFVTWLAGVVGRAPASID